MENRVMIGGRAPDFTANAVMPNNDINNKFNLHEYLEGHYGVVFFYPLDFTFVCPTEILTFSKEHGEFSKRGARVVGISIDSHFTHLAWKNTPVKNGGIGNINYPLVADLTKQICKDYGVLAPAGIAYRGTFLIDKNGVVRHQIINDLPLGRNINDTIRTLDALIYHEKNGEVCPANWEEGKEAMKPTQEGVASYLAANIVE
jgi:peroxiredoxin (alkyl hydroperoxide reductase subunit C)